MPLFNLRGISLPHKKGTAKSVPCAIPSPKSVLIPLSMHIGAPATPVVKTGDTVKIGQVIAEVNGYVSAKIHASVSGKVKSTDTAVLSNGKQIPSILIESDGLDEIYEGITPPTINSFEDFIAAIRESGIVGLGGAGFPTAVKLNTRNVDQIIVNGAECEPYITSDTRTMLDRVDDIRDGLDLIARWLAPKQILFGIEKNKPECIASMSELCKNYDNASVRALKSLYPQGGEKVLIYHLTKKVVPEGKLPLDVGVVVINCTTLAEIGKYAKTGMPLVSKCITIDGGAVAEPKNIIAPIGTRISEIIESCGGLKVPAKKILLGGPMMGWAVESVEMPVMKNTNALLFFTEKEATYPKESNCIKCGACTNICPLGLDPKAFVQALRANDDDALVTLKANICMECGCCSYVCPSKRLIVHTNKISKERALQIIKQRKEENQND